MATEKLGLEEINLSQAGKEVSHNTALRQIEGRMIGALSATTAAPPASPVAGDVYIIPVSPTPSGEWTGKERQIAHFYGGIWNYWTPTAPVRLWVTDTQLLKLFDGTDWVTLSAPTLVPPFSDANTLVKGSADATKLLRLEVDGFTTATTRVATFPNKSFTVAGTDDITTHEAAADPHTGYQKESEKGAASGYASLDSGVLVPAAQLPAVVGDTGSGGTKGAAPAPAAGDAAASKFLKADGTWSTVSGASGGTVTSVAMTVPAELSVSGSPITSSGTLAVTKANQSANQVYAGPTSGSAAAPAFRALVAADIPAQPYDVGSFIEAAPTASQVVLRHVTARAVTFPSSLTGSYGKAGTAATAQTDFDLQKGGVSFGTMRFAAAGTSATFISASGTTTAAGDVITAVAPATPDATLAKITFTLAGTR